MEDERLDGCQVLIVEDEMLIAAQLEEQLSELGCSAQVASTVEEALRLLKSTSFDAAFLDLNLNGETSLLVAGELAKSGTPYVFTTGYQSEDVAIDGAVPLLAKPFTESEAEGALRKMASHRSTRVSKTLTG